MYSQTKIDITIFLGFVGSIAMICIAIFAGEFEGTILYYGPDVKFGTLVLDTPGEWWAFFLAQLALGILDVAWYEWVNPYYNQATNFEYIPIVTENHGKGDTGSRLLFALKSTSSTFPMMIRVTLSVIFVTTQIMSVILVQVIKEVFIFVIVYQKVTAKYEGNMWMSQKEADEFEKKNDKKKNEVGEDTPLLGAADGGYSSVDLKRRNNIRF